MDKSVKKFVFGLRKFEHRVYFILLLGYFRAKPLAHDFDVKDVKKDLAFVLEKYFNQRKLSKFSIQRKVRIRLFNRLLEHTGFVRYKPGKHKGSLIEKLIYVATINTEPRYLFDECLAFLSQRLIVLPGYTTIVDLITNVIVDERKRIKKVLKNELPKKTRSKLLDLLTTKNRITDLSKLKKPSADFSVSEIKRELKAHDNISPIFNELKGIIKKLCLSPSNLEYYASMVRYKSVYFLRRQTNELTLLYLICYLYFRYQETNDNLISAFIYLVRKIQDSSKKYAKKKILDDINVIRNELKTAGELLAFFVDGDIPNTEEFGKVRRKAFKLLSKRKIKILSNHLNETEYDTHHYAWEFIDEKSKQIQNTIRSIFLTIDIDFNHLKQPLSDQFKLTRKELLNNKSIESINVELVNKHERKFIENQKSQSLRFEYFLYRKILRLFDKESITVRDSISNKNLESDLIPIDEWEANKESIVKKVDQRKISESITENIKDKLDSLEETIEAVTNTIAIGENQYVEYLPGKNKFKWSISHQRWQESIDNPIYKQIQHIGIVELMGFVNQQTGFIEAFRHLTTNKEIDAELENDLFACALANATNCGLYKMANISDRSIGKLRSVEDQHLRSETLKEANDFISDAIAQLPIFSYYNINDNYLFSSIDGQNFECRINTFKARFSSKDFFKGKGVSALTLVSNYVPVNAMLNGSNEYEGHFAFDLLYNNTSKIQPNVLSTDTHGTNNVNFAILDFFDYQFAPRYARVKKIFFDLFNVLEDKDGQPMIQLSQEIDVKLIESEWDSIQRILCSLSNKTASQNTIVRKLSNGKNRTLSALHEYDRLVKSIYILNYIDRAELRHYVQQALNRGEAYHQLRRAIATVNGAKFRGGNDYQVDLWNDCGRLVANCIIYYNSSLLSTLLQISEEEGRTELEKYFSQLSPVAWRHINLNGEYSFRNDFDRINLLTFLDGIDID